MNKSDNKITVIIPNYNNQKLLANLLESLKQVTLPHDIIIVDNASSDNSTTYIKTNFPEITLIENKTNTGFAHAVNQAIKIATTDYVLLLNNDTIVTESAFKNMFDLISTDSSIFSVTSKMIQKHNPNLIDDTGDEYSIMGWTKKRGFNHSVSEFTQSGEVFGACAGAALYRRLVFLEIGYFDENFESYVEDVDISIRARLYGYTSYYCADTIIYHYGSATSGSKYNSFKVRISARNNIYLLYKNLSLWMKIVNFIFIVMGIVIKYLYFYRKGYGQDYIGGVCEGFRTRKQLDKIEGVSFKNYLKLELLLIKNTFKYLS